MDYAGFWRRTLALIVDILVEAPIFVLAFFLFRASLVGAIGSVFVGAVAFAYPIYFHARWGQTLGKMAVKIRVVQVDGRPVTARNAFLRSSVDLGLWMVYAVATVWVLTTWDGPAWSSLDWLRQRELVDDRNPFYTPYDIASQVWLWSEVVVLLFNRRRRALHDFLAGTVVIKVKPEERTFEIGEPSVEPVVRG